MNDSLTKSITLLILPMALAACSEVTDPADPSGAESLENVQQAAGAGDSSTVLILNTTVTGNYSSREAIHATSAGYTVELVSPAQWATKSAADFASYRAIILGDATCSGLGAISAAEANLATWGSKVNGNVIIMGSDPVFHQAAGGDTFTKNAIEFAAADPAKTGLYISLSCYYAGVPVGTPVPILSTFGAFTVQGVDCATNVHKVATHPALNGTTDETLSNWNCSVHEAFDTFPATFLPLAIARFPGSPGNINFPDGSFGVPYILARSPTLVPVLCGNGILETGEACDDSNITNGDGCSAQCKIEAPVCGNSILETGEACDDGNTTSCDGCSSACSSEPTAKCVTIQRGLFADVSDTFIADNTPTSTYGSSGKLFVGQASGGTRQSLLSFDTRVIPLSACVGSAEFGLTEENNTGIETLAVHAATDWWSEYSTSYASFGGAFDPGVLATFSNVGPGPGGTSGPTSFSSAGLKSLVQDWVSGAEPNDGLLLEVASGPGNTTFRSSEHSVINERPRLTVCYVP